jgi:hypothetical protein
MPASAVVRAQSSCAHRCIPHGQPNECSRTSIELTRLSGPHIGRHGPLCATVTCEDPDVHSQWAEDGFEAISLCEPQTGIGAQPMPARGGTGASHPRPTPNFHEIAGLTRSNAKARRILRSHKDACTCRTRATAGIPQDPCRTQAASSQFRHNRQCSRRTGRWLGVALGYRQPWLPTCAIPSRHRPKIRGAHNVWHPRLNSAHRFQPANRT